MTGLHTRLPGRRARLPQPRVRPANVVSASFSPFHELHAVVDAIVRQRRARDRVLGPHFWTFADDGDWTSPRRAAPMKSPVAPPCSTTTVRAACRRLP